jgi:hypothetical protein
MSDEARAYVKRYSPFRNGTFWVHYALADIANRTHDYELWVADGALINEWPLSKSAIHRAYGDLVKAGFLTIISPPAPGRRARYRFEFVDVPPIRDCTLSQLGTTLSQVGTTSSQDEKRSPIYRTEKELKDNATPKWSDEVEALTQTLAEKVSENTRRPVNVTDAWRTSIDRIIRLDGYTADEVDKVIRWATADEFWRANILSADKLRKRLPQLRLQMERGDGRRARVLVTDEALAAAMAWGE